VTLVPLRKEMSGRQRDYLMLTAFVLARHGYVERALILVEAMIALGERGERVDLARVVLKFLEKDYAGALADLDRLEDAAASQPGPSAPKSPETVRIRRYLRARCYCETGRRQEGEAIARALSAG